MPESREAYQKTQWENDVTELNEENLNHMERGIELNNLLAKECANYIDEIFSAFIIHTELNFDLSTKQLFLTFGKSTGQDATPRFNASFVTSIPIVDPVMTEEDLNDCWGGPEEIEE